MRVHLTVMAAALALMVAGTAASEGGQPQKRSILHYPNNGSPAPVPPVTSTDESNAQDFPIHQPPEVSALAPAAKRRVIRLQHGPQDVSSQASQAVFLPPPTPTRAVKYGQWATSANDGETDASAGDGPKVPAGYGGSPYCGSGCCAPSCCASTCCGSCCGSIFSKLLGGHCGCG